MEYINRARRFSPCLVMYLMAGVLVKLISDAFSTALSVCEMYPHFSFLETLIEEIRMHYTWFPLVHVYIPTLHLLGAYAVVYLTMNWGLVDRGWPLLVDLLSGRWLYYYVFDVLPELGSEPDVPELVSDDEEGEMGLNEDDRYNGNVSSSTVDSEACNEAIAKLKQVKMKHANRIIPRPDDWLVFDPVQEKLVLQKCVNGTIRSEDCNGSKVDLSREQEHIGDSLVQESLSTMQTDKDVDANVVTNQFPEATTGMRKRI